MATQSPILTLVVPTYNERANLEELVGRVSTALAGIAWEMVIVDDDSPDGTAAFAKDIARRDPRVRCIRRVNRRGLSGACIDGMLSSAAPYVGVMDADMQHDETILPKMLERLTSNEADLVVGSRHQDGGSADDGFSEFRAQMSRAAIRLAQWALKTDVNDITSGFFMLRRDVVDAIAPALLPSGFKILADIVGSVREPLRIVEIGYVFRGRAAGESKMDLKVALDFVGLLVNKVTRGVVPVRFILFALVGALGVVVHLGVLRLALSLPGLGFLAAQSVATIVAMTSNFFINNQFTYRDSQLRGLAILRGLIFFYAVCSLGALANVGVGTWIYGYNHVWWAAGLAGVIMGSVWNYALSSVFVWRRQD